MLRRGPAKNPCTIVFCRYSDQRFRRTVALFWGSIWADKNFQKQQKESRKIEDLILPFVTTATKALKKDEELVEGAWKWELNLQIGLFLNLISDSIHSIGPISPELSGRLESYKTRLQAPATATVVSEKNGRNGYGSGTEKGGDKSDVESVRSSKSGIGGAGTGGTIAVAALFGLGEEDLQARLKALQGVCTEQVSVQQ